MGRTGAPTGRRVGAGRGGGVRRRGDGVQERIGDKGEAVKNLRIEGLQKRTREKISRSMI